MGWRSRLAVSVVVILGLVFGGVVVAAAAGVPFLAPLRLAAHYPWGVLADEARMLEGCTAAGCHEPAKMHTCLSCHDAHGEARLSGISWSGLVLLTGDVPEPDYIPIHDILPLQEFTRTAMPLLDLLTKRGLDDFESVTLVGSDGGQVTIARESLGPGSLLLPYADGVRFADENLHISSWIKGIERIVVVGRERPLKIDGRETSIGRLLLGPTRFFPVEPATVMLRSAEDGQVRRVQTAMRLEGVALADVLDNPTYTVLRVRDVAGREHVLSAEESRGALLAVVFGRVTLVLPEQGRGQWIGEVVEVEGE